MYRKLGVTDVEMYAPGYVEALNGKGISESRKLRVHYDESSIVHCFSGGYYLYLMSLLRNEDGELLRLPKALIVDSAPIEPVTQSVHRYMKHGHGIHVNRHLLHHVVQNTWKIQDAYYTQHAKQHHCEDYRYCSKMSILKDLNQRIFTVTQIPTLCMVASSDKVLDVEYCDNWAKHHQCEYVKYDMGKHARLFASNGCYFNRINTFIQKLK